MAHFEFDNLGKTVPVRENHALPIDSLQRHLVKELPEFVSPIKKLLQFKGGQSNPTYFIEDTASNRYVLRKKPHGKILKSAHAVDREFKVMKALSTTAVPVPNARFLCEDPTVIGTTFYIMDYVEGRVFTDIQLSGLPPRDKREIFLASAAALASIHDVDLKAVGLQTFGRPENYYKRQLARWSSQYQQSCAAGAPAIAAMERLIAYLRHNLPDDNACCLVHGDFRIDNLIFHPSKNEVVAVLDWELSTLGHPLADLSYNCLMFHLPSGLPHLSGLSGVDLDSLGIPNEEEYVRHYCGIRGISCIRNWSFYLAFSLFRSAAILQGVYARALQGNASDARALTVGGMAQMMVEGALELTESTNTDIQARL